ncbi:hypothetical protein KY285_003696 [Solanum tuberosum]|nr:hypothetical protein KY284_000307 [Solanum tuberosum]KAH0767825.1 hypothetical protein KY285_003696 [Solanum tuberosum]
MAALSLRKGNTRLPPEVNRVLYVRNLPFNITSEEMYDIFGKYGAIRQIRIGTNKDTRGTAFVVYEDIYDAKTAVDHLSGFNVANRYLIVLYYQQAKMSKKFDQKKKEDEITKLQEKYVLAKSASPFVETDQGTLATELSDRVACSAVSYSNCALFDCSKWMLVNDMALPYKYLAPLIADERRSLDISVTIAQNADDTPSHMLKKGVIVNKHELLQKI